MYRFLLRPKWVAFHLLVLGAIVGMVNLGLWQLDRLDARRTFNAEVADRYDEPPVAIDAVLTPGTDPDDVEWRPVVVSGTYLDGETIRIVNRSQNGRAGDNIVVPLRLDDGRLLLVNRGFLVLGFDVPPVPAGRVTITGRLRPSQERRTGQLSDASDGELSVAQRVDIDRLAPQLDGEVVAMYVDRFASEPADDPVLEPVIRPDLGEGSHLSYAVQWFIFSVAVAIGWFLAVRRSIATRRHAHDDRSSTPIPTADMS